jgi:dihydroflavonol-4-reductase
MELLVTGATGYLGGQIVRAALARGDRVRALVRPGSPHAWLDELGVACVEGDLCDERSLLGAARGIEGLVHCAARMGYWSRQDEEQRRTNVEGTSAILRAAGHRHVARIVHVSSVAAVGANRDGRPLTEDSAWPGRDGPGLNYVLTKRESEERALAAVRQGLPVVVVNPGAMLGPRADGKSRAGLAARARSGVRRVPPGGSTFADVCDVAQGCLAALERGRTGERYLLGGHNLSWLALQELLAARAGAPLPRGTRGALEGRLLERATTLLDLVGLSRPRFAPELYRTWGWYTCADSGKAQRELGYAFRPLEELAERALAATGSGKKNPGG